MLLSKYKSVNSLSPNHFYLLRLKILIVFFSSMALRLSYVKSAWKQVIKIASKKTVLSKKRMNITFVSSEKWGAPMDHENPYILI